MADTLTSAPALAFHSTTFDVVDLNGQPWLRAVEIGKALGYADEKAIQRIYTRRQDEFTPAMTGVVKVTTPSGMQDARVFSLRGAHLLAMFARTETAKEFRRWVLDVLEQRINEFAVATPYSVQPGQTLSAEQAQALRSMIENQAKRHYSDTAVQGRYIKTVWSKLKSHFKVPYRQIPADEFTNAISIVVRHEVEWELVDDEPKASTLNEAVAHLVKQLEAPNGAPAIVFMPLVNAVLRKQGFQFLPDSSRMLPSHQADEVLVRLNRLAQLFHPFSEPFMDVMGVLRALRGLGPKLGMHEPSYHQVIERVRA